MWGKLIDSGYRAQNLSDPIVRQYPLDTNDNGPEVMQNTPGLWLPQLEDNDITVQKIQYVKPVLYKPEHFLSKHKDTATGNAGQMIQNNPNMQHHALELSGVIEKMVKLPSGHNSIYGVDDLNTGMINASMQDCSIGGCANAQRMNMALKGDKSKHRIPSDRWFAAVLASADVDDTKDHFVKSAVRYLGQITRHRKKPKEGFTFVIDMHLIPRYDRKSEELTRSRHKSGTTYFERYVSIQCVDEDMRLIMGFEPLGALGNAHDAVEQLLDTLLDNGMPIRLVLFDRGFFSTSMLELLNRLHIPYLMPCVNTQGVVSALNEFAEFQRMGVSVNMLKGSGRKIPYILIITHRRSGKDSPTEPKDRFVGFATNMPDMDLAEYDKRWGIETGYSMIEKIRARTRSRKMSSRVFCFAFTLMMYNVWVTLNAIMAYYNTPVMYSHMTLTAFRVILLDIASSVSSRRSKDGLQGNGGGDCAKPSAIA